VQTHYPATTARDSVASMQRLRTSHAYLRLLQVLEELAAEGFLRRSEQQLLRDTADALLFDDADSVRWLDRAERVLETLVWRDELSEREVATLRERLRDIEPVGRRSLAS
jgi:hypothetical protein